MDYTEAKILVIGLARSGMAAIKLLRAAGAKNIILSERKEVPQKEYLESLGVKVIGQDDAVFEEDYDLVIKNPGVPPVSPQIRRLKERGIPVITEIELAYRLMKPQHIVAITGTNGKTTTTTLTYEILRRAYGSDHVHVCGNIGIPLSEIVLQEGLTQKEGHYIALEISNAQLVDIESFRAEVSVIVNLTPDHIDQMGGLENYYASKTRVYLNSGKDDVFLKNADDEIVSEYTEKFPAGCRVHTFSLDSHADSCIEDGWMTVNGTKVLEISRVQLPGKHNLQNILIAATACMYEHVRPDIIADVVYGFKGVEHRIEFVREIDGVKYYNDSKGTNTDATITALKAFDHGVILLVGGFEKGLPMDEMRRHLGCVKQVIGYGAAGPRIAHDLVGEKAIIVEALPEAVAEAKKLAVSGDTVLLSPTTSSFDQYSCFEERGEHFKEIVNAL